MYVLFTQCVSVRDHPSSMTIYYCNHDKLTWALWILHYIITVIMSAPLLCTCNLLTGFQCCQCLDTPTHFVCCDSKGKSQYLLNKGAYCVSVFVVVFAALMQNSGIHWNILRTHLLEQNPTGRNNYQIDYFPVPLSLHNLFNLRYTYPTLYFLFMFNMFN